MSQLNFFHKNREMVLFFLTGSFLITNSLSKKRLCSTADLFSIIRIFLINSHKICKNLYIFQRGFEVLKLQYFKPLCVLPMPEANSEPNQTSEMELFAESR